MANQEQLDILKQGVEVWNQWREEHPDMHPNLIGAVLNEADLGSANLSEANLMGADLRDADLRDANLSGAYLLYAYLGGADLGGADLGGANLDRAIVGDTSFGDINLSVVNNLETVKHEGPSTIGIDTIYRSQGKIPEAFLKEAGVPDSFLAFVRILVSKHIDYYSCFISYSSKDEALARRLYDDLQSNHVRCWFAPEDLKIGAKIRSNIDESIRLHDKLLLILSQYSVASQWIEQEVVVN